MCVFPITGTLCCFPAFWRSGLCPGAPCAAWGGLLQPAPAAGVLCACRLPILRELAQGMVPDWWLAPGLGLVLKGPVSSHLAMPRAQATRGLLLHAVVMFPVAAAAALLLLVSHWGWSLARPRVGWNGALLMDWWVLVARRLWPVEKHYRPVPPRVRQCSQTMVSLLRSQGPACALLAQLPWMWANGDG